MGVTDFVPLLRDRWIDIYEVQILYLDKHLWWMVGRLDSLPEAVRVAEKRLSDIPDACQARVFKRPAPIVVWESE